MQNHIISKFDVIGISARISNQGDVGKEIEALWERFWGEEIQKQVPNKINDDIYAVYTDYVTDHTGPYTLLIGLSVKSLEDIPEGFTSISIEKDTYQKFVSKGRMPEAVFKTWLEIWGNSDLKRAFRSDFTIHGKKYFDGDNAEVETFISVQD
ncbi:MAG: effector binding domain-containing protein [Bacteroidota bacterium]